MSSSERLVEQLDQMGGFDPKGGSQMTLIYIWICIE